MAMISNGGIGRAVSLEMTDFTSATTALKSHVTTRNQAVTNFLK